MSATMSRNTFKISIFIIIVKTGQQWQKRNTGIKIFLYPNTTSSTSSCEKLFIYQKQKMHQRQKPESFWTIKMKDTFLET